MLNNCREHDNIINNNKIPSEEEVPTGGYQSMIHSGTIDYGIMSLKQPKMSLNLNGWDLIQHNIAIFKSLDAEMKWVKWLMKKGYTLDVSLSHNTMGKDQLLVAFASKGDFVFHDISPQLKPLARKAEQLGGVLIWTGGHTQPNTISLSA